MPAAIYTIVANFEDHFFGSYRPVTMKVFSDTDDLEDVLEAAFKDLNHVDGTTFLDLFHPDHRSFSIGDWLLVSGDGDTAPFSCIAHLDPRGWVVKL